MVTGVQTCALPIFRDLIGELPKEKLKDTRYYHNKKTKISDIIGVNVV